MAHHLAGVLRELSETNEDGRSALEKEARELVVALWSKRWLVGRKAAQRRELMRLLDLDEGVASQSKEGSEDLQRAKRSLSDLLGRLRDAFGNKPTAK